MSQFLHGVEVIEAQTGTRPVKTVKSSVIGLIGTAPFADTDMFPANTPVLVAGRRADAAPLVNTENTDFIAKLAERKEAAALAATQDDSPAYLTALEKAYKANNSEALTDEQKTAVKEKVAAKARESVEDIADSDKGTLFSAIDGIFDQAGAAIVVVRIEEGLDDKATATNVQDNVKAFLDAESELGFAPRILIAPEFTHQFDADNGSANPVVAEMIGVAERLRAVIIADGPSADENIDLTKANSLAIQYRQTIGSRRVFVVDPGVKVMKDGMPKVEPASARVAGMLVKSDNDRGFWWSPSNTNMNGILGSSRAIDFQLGDRNARANLLNENEVATIIRQNGFKLWGNRTCSDDPKWAFLSVVRTADMINDSLLRAHMWAVDRNITKTYVQDVVESVQAYLDSLTAQGAILGGKIWADEDLNTPANIQAGKVFFSFDFTPPTPAEHITFKSILTNNYLEEIV